MTGFVKLLGTGTCQLEPNRAASSVLINLDGLSVLFDMGRGVAHRLVEAGLRQDDLRHVVFSHFHPDHLSDLIPYLHAASWSPSDPRNEDLHLWGPPGLEQQMKRLLGLFEGRALNGGNFTVHIHEVSQEELLIEGRSFDWVSLPPAGNHGLGFRFSNVRVGLTGDSFFHKEEIAFLSRLDMAIIDSGHLKDEEIVELAVQSGVSVMVCSHLYRELNIDELNQRACERGYEGIIRSGFDGEVVLPSLDQ